MGYRSDVAFAIDKKDYFSAIVLESKFPKIFNDENCFTKTEVEIEESTNLYFFCTEIKWYPGYPDIDEAEAFMDHLETNDIEFAFLRRGEAMEDNQERGSPWNFDMYISRTIEMPY